jgi:uncharacterized membrane protein YphA (DoxX/SURF4 family)
MVGIRALTEFHGSTRGVGLLRFFWGLILWVRWGQELLPFRSLNWEHWLLGALFFLGTSGMVIGLFSRAACLLTGLTTLYMVFVVGHKMGMESWGHHHTTFLAVVSFLLAFTPCGKSFSADRWLRILRCGSRGTPWPQEWGNLWAVRLIGLQLSAIYFWGAIDKSRLAFLGGDRVEQPLMYLYFGSDFPGEWFHWACMALAMSSVLLEYTLALGLWFRRTRTPLIWIGIVFHIGLYYFLPVTVFSVASVVAYIAYIEPSAIHRFFDQMLSVGPSEE